MQIRGVVFRQEKAQALNDASFNDIMARNRRPAVRARLGPIAATAAGQGFSVPLSARQIMLIRDLTNGERAWDMDNQTGLAAAGKDNAA
jgi:hypothetical protein